jgi:fatty-acyl-CoA synthase
VQVQGPNVTTGYWQDPGATADAFVDGWLRTGDIAVVDDEGYLTIVDRLKDMYISGGENVYPAEVEQAIHSHPSVAECAVIGVPDERWGEVGRAVVTLRDGAGLTEAELVAHLEGRLARYKVPRSVVFVDELPHNASGKLVKSRLKELQK